MEGNGNLHDPAALSPKRTRYPSKPTAELTATKKLHGKSERWCFPIKPWLTTDVPYYF
jgi:hypothetical protein